MGFWQLAGWSARVERIDSAARSRCGRLYSGGSYFASADDAQRVLDDFHSGAAEVLGLKGNDIVVRTSNVTGFNHNPGAGFPNQPTNVFFIKGSSSPSIVPFNPAWAP